MKLTKKQQIKNLVEVMFAISRLTDEEVEGYYQMSKVEKIKEYAEMLLELVGV